MQRHRTLGFVARLATPVLVSLLAAACGSDGKGGKSPPADGSGVVGSAGGTVSLSGGPTLTIPPGALSADTTITIKKSANTVDGALTALYEFGPDGTTFASPVTVSFPVPSGTSGASIYWTKSGSSTEFDSLATTVGGTAAVAQVTHFSLGCVGPAPEPVNYAISGTVAGEIEEWVTVSVVGTPYYATTDASGNYTLHVPGLAWSPSGTGASYSVVPTLLGYTFSPDRGTVTLSGSTAQVRGPDFTATQVTVPLFSDSFERAAGSVGNGWTDPSGNALSTSACDLVDDGSGANKYLRIRQDAAAVNGDSRWTNYHLSAKFKVASLATVAELRFRVQDANNYYAVRLTNGTTLTLVRHTSASSDNLAASAVSYGVNALYPVKVLVDGPSIKVYFNGQSSPTIALGDLSSPFASGRIALYANGSSSGSPAFFDDVSVTSPLPVLYTLHWDGPNGGGDGWTGTYEVSTHFAPSDLVDLVGGHIVKVRMYLYSKPDVSFWTMVRYGGSTQPGGSYSARIIDLATLQAGAWNEFSFADDPMTILADTDYWVGASVSSSGYPIGADRGPPNPKGDWLNRDGSGWAQYAYANWNIQAVIEAP